MDIRKLLKVFFKLEAARLGKEISMPLNTITTMVGSGCYFLTHFLAFSLIISKFEFPGWNTSELWVLFFTFETFTYLSFFLLWKGLSNTVSDISQGKFDFIVSKPISSRFLSMIRGGGLHNFVAMLVGIVFLSTVIVRGNIDITPVGVILFITTMILSIWILHCLSVIFISVNFFFGKTEGSAGAIFQFQETMKYPATSFSEINPIAQVLVLPTSLLTSIPVMFLLEKVSFNLLGVYLFVFIVFTIFSNYLWNRGINKYSSASS